MHGGIWTLCIDLSDSEMRQLGRFGFPNAHKCISYLAENAEINRNDEYSPHDYQLTRRPSMSKILHLELSYHRIFICIDTKIHIFRQECIIYRFHVH